MRQPWIRGVVCALAAVVVAPAASVGAAAPVDGAEDLRALLDRYCVTCHNERLRTGNLALDRTPLDPIRERADVWEKVLLKLEERAMPPPGRRARPEPAAYDAAAAWLEGALDRAAETAPDPGRPAIHRLNRAEYANAVRDLLALEIDAPALLPADDLGFGFDNNADLLNVSPALMERYVSAAHKVSRMAVGDPRLRPAAETYELSRTRVQDDRVGDAMPFGSRGGVSVRHRFPLDGVYELRLRLQRDIVGNIYGLQREERIELRIDGEQVALFRVGGDLDCARASLAGYHGCLDADGQLVARVAVPAGTRDVGAGFLRRTLAPEGLTPRRVPVSSFILSAAKDPPESERMALEHLVIDGPYDAAGPGDTASRHRIFLCRPDQSTPGGDDDGAGADARADAGPAEAACARRILGTLARRAYRRPATEADVATLMEFFAAGREDGGFDGGIQRALTRLLVDPEFLFRIETDPPGTAPGTAYRLSDLELASRLSFFLWSSIPDDELLDAAAAGRLRDPATLERQVRRMLADRRSEALVENFVAQWLHLRNMNRVTPDVNRFPEFDDNLREAFARETELLVASELRADRGVADLLTADYTFVNERLARHYGLPGVYGSRFRRVDLGAGAPGGRGGLLGHASILTVTSHATRTSPVLRGKWVLENILGAPPPPPPDDVPALDENTPGEPHRSVRARLEQHRANPVCASCHARMDPLGFALEGFDGIGRWRAADGDVPLDTSATLPDGTAFDGPAELRALLAERREAFVRTVAARMLTYALGRGLEAHDQPAVRRMVREAAPEYRWSSLVAGIARSAPFTMRRSEP